MKCTIQVTAQYYENYSDTNTPHWKPKGGVDFHFPIDDEVVLYAPTDVLENALIKMVEEQSNSQCRYEYIDHQVKFSNPIVVEGLDRELEKMLIS
jgi:nucleoid-associated protein YejK